MLSVLIIGCGNIAGGFDAERIESRTPFTHAGAYRAHGGFRLLACVDPDAARRAAFQQRWGVEHAFETLEQARAHGLQFDVVSICSPTHCHADDLHAALAFAPKLVFCEKPLTDSLEASAALAARYHRARIPLVVNYSRRWDERVRALRAQLKNREWGSVRAVRAIYNKGLYNNGSHMLDLFTLLFGPLSVIATGPAIVDMWEADPSIPAMLSSANGEIITLSCADARDYAMFELELVTERGTIAMENGGLDWHVRHACASPTFSGYQSLGSRTHLDGTLSHAALAAVTEIHSVVTQGHKPSCTADDAVAVQRVCETIRTRECAFSLRRNNP